MDGGQSGALVLPHVAQDNDDFGGQRLFIAKTQMELSVPEDGLKEFGASKGRRVCAEWHQKAVDKYGQINTKTMGAAGRPSVD
jgi:hypothetical protein